MKTLDCESIETIYRSIHDILGITRLELEQIYKEVDLDRYYSENSNFLVDPEELLLSLIVGKDVSVPSYDRVCWFHLTRIHNESTFDAGILPLNEVIESIWNFLYSLIKDNFTINEWQSFRTNMGPSDWAHLY